MPRQKRGNQRTRKDIRRGESAQGERRELVFAEDGQVYGLVKELKGAGRFDVFCYDGQTRMGILRGKMHKREWVRKDSTVLLGLRDFEPSKADIIHVYQHSEVRLLQQYNEIPRVESSDAQEVDDGVDFDDI